MKKICKNIYVGDISDCFYEQRNGFAVILACKTTCHQKEIGYSRNLPPVHPNYLISENERHLYLNLVDMNKILPQFADPIFFKAIKFIEDNISENEIIIHCNLGQSRSPALALVYIARENLIINDSYQMASQEFKQIYLNYSPGIGINNYLMENWGRIVY